MSALSAVSKARLRLTGRRNDASGITATVFGCTGFLGRYVTSELGRIGSTSVLPFRGDEMETRHLRVMSDLGNSAIVPFNIRDPESVKNAIEGSDVVINLIGKHYETKHFFPWWINYTYDDVHVEAATTIAQAVAEITSNPPRLIHHSSIAASPNSPSIWAASKYRGEVAVKKIFPNVNIVRSSTMYGHEDRFLNWYANRASQGGVVPLINNGDARVSPVNVCDVAKAILAIATDSSINGAEFELTGEDEYSHKEIAEYVFDVMKEEPNMLNVPLSVARVFGTVADKFPDPKFTKDLATLLTIDQVKTGRNLPGLRELDIEPSNMETEAFDFMVKYNRGGKFEQVSGYH